MKKLSIYDRTVMFAEYMLDEKTTVRQTAKYFGFSKSTVHKDLSSRLKTINGELYKEIAVLLNDNLVNRHIRGGNATKRKYTELKKNDKQKSK